MTLTDIIIPGAVLDFAREVRKPSSAIHQLNQLVQLVGAGGRALVVKIGIPQLELFRVQENLQYHV